MGRRVKWGNFIASDSAEQCNAARETEARDLGLHLPDRLRVTPAIAGNHQPPRQMLQSGQRSDQHIVALARDDRADREERHDISIVTRRNRDAIRSRLDDADPAGRNTIIFDEQPGDHRARRNDVPRTAESGALTCVEGSKLCRLQPRLERQRMMHQRNQRMVRAQRLRGTGQNPEGEAIDHDWTPGRECRQARTGRGARLRRGIRETVAKLDHTGSPTKRRKLRDDATIIGVAPGRGGKVAWHRKEGLLYHNEASYQARATGDSATVTLIDLSSRPSRPSLPARAAAAKCSKRCLVKNSLVVLIPLNCGNSSRLREW